ncbi:MAG: 30S ribosome-binding factor RbfA [Rhodospirillaceae bacterium]|nr:30S ribosome-binding factor RbfA [Rhodospirillaceae bacterium]
MRKAHDHETASGRHLRVGEAIRHALVEIIAKGRFHEPELHDASITITEARATPDLRHVTVFVMPLGGRDRDEVVAALNRVAPALRGEVTRAVRLKFAPQLRFEADRSFDATDRVTQLLSDPRVARDLDQPLPHLPPPRKRKTASGRRRG